MILPRTIEHTLKKTAGSFAAVVLTGPRQSGKTTLLTHLFGKTHTYINLENPDTVSRIYADPIGFLASTPTPVILDEIQYAPILLPYIKERIDRNRKPGTWLITGSQNFALMKRVTESLAGRAAILTLLPLSLAEQAGNGRSSRDIHALLTNTKRSFTHAPNHTYRILQRGSYPEPIQNATLDYRIWANSYIKTYLERDVREIKNVGSLMQFRSFLQSCAIRTGQILDLSSIARDLGISFTTAKQWLSVLCASYQVFLVEPYYHNLGKRLVKRPKLYVADTGLAASLMGLTDTTSIRLSPQYGALFETMVVVDMIKRFYHHGQEPRLYYLRTRDGLEVDLVIEDRQKLSLIEIKSGSTITTVHANALFRLKRDTPNTFSGSILLTNAPQSFILSGVVQHPAIPFLSES